ncbi:MAG: hypothetical protein ACI86M_002266 [Saprospiraceae bacterium]
MITSNYLQYLPIQLKILVGVFLVVLSVGYFSGLAFVENTSGASQSGIVENYNGNEENEEALEMKFKKSDHEMLNIIHTHILSMSIIFFILGGLVYGADINSKLKSFLMIEPLISVLVTFGGIYMIWMGMEWMSYIVMLSGCLMTFSFMGSILVIYRGII